MILKRLRPKQGIKFAWLPIWTDEGKVWLEWVHFSWNDTEFGSYSYARWIPEKDYNEGKRAQAKFYSTPPGDPKTFCKNYRTDGPTPCHYPNCKMLDAHGDERCAVDTMKFGEW